MFRTTLRDTCVELPEGYTAIPVSIQQQTTPLKVSVVVRKEPDPVSGHLVVLRDTIDARAFLGIVSDTQTRVHQWVEVWVQDLEGLTKVAPACVQSLSNEVLDRRWESQVKSLEQLEQPSLIKTGWETQHPLPTFFDLNTLEPVHPKDSDDGYEWTLCQDDRLLKGRDLPLYSTSLHRYLYLPEVADQSAFVPVTPEAPTNAHVKPLSEITGRRQRLVAFNPGGGLMMVRPYSPIGYETFVDILSGESWDGHLHGRSVLAVGNASEVLSDEHHQETSSGSNGRLFMGHHGRWGRLIEGYHLKLRLIGDTLHSVRTLATHTQKPILNLSPDSFQIRLGEPGWAIPYLWSATAALVDPGDAVALPIQTSDADYYLSGGVVGASIYRSDSAKEPVQGRGLVRVRQILDTGGGGKIIEGTFTTQEQVTPARYDLAWFRLNLNNGRADLYARLEEESALAAGEWRFRTVAQRLGESAMEGLRAAEGVPMPDVRFEIIPYLSTPIDLYALAVLAVRTLLVDKETRLSIALDEILSLAKHLSNEWNQELSLPAQIRDSFAIDNRWVQSLGPHRLVHESITPEEAFDLIPMELWWDTLAAILRMFPGATPASHSRDYGDAPPGGIHKVFDRALEELEAIILRTRSLILIDWRFNREVHTVIRRHVTGMVHDAESGV